MNGHRNSSTEPWKEVNQEKPRRFALGRPPEVTSQGLSRWLAVKSTPCLKALIGS
uniref:Uncharacterized protein n=1 Tax=Anguilla anguilla TaxID=7936 RepID=A0A0E9VGT2_ANGAN